MKRRPSLVVCGFDIRPSLNESLNPMNAVDEEMAFNAHLNNLCRSVFSGKMKRCRFPVVYDIDIRPGINKSLDAMDPVNEEMALNALTWTMSV